MQVHDGRPPLPDEWWAAWHWEPQLLLWLALLLGFYLHGVRRLWRHAGGGRGVGYQHLAAFLAGVAILFLALVSPLDALGGALFSAHMVQHLLLMLVAAPLLVLGRPLMPFLWALPRPLRRGVAPLRRRTAPARVLAHLFLQPAPIWGFHAAVLWLWHLPGLYQAALRSEGVHRLEHAAFLVSALLFWWALRAMAGDQGENGGAAVLYLFTTGLQSGALGALITFASAPWYPLYVARTLAWGLTPMEDQQLAGVIMWVPAGILYLVAAAIFLVTWLQALERRNPAQGHGGRGSEPEQGR